MPISNTRSKLLIATLVLSVNFTSHIHAMERLFGDCITLSNDWNLSSIDNQESFSFDWASFNNDRNTPFIAREIFSDNLMTHMHEDFLQAVYNQDNLRVEQLICPPALKYLETHFHVAHKEVEQILAWTIKSRYTEIFRSIAKATKLAQRQEEPKDDFWGAW